MPRTGPQAVQSPQNIIQCKNGTSYAACGLGLPGAECGEMVPPLNKSCCVALFRDTSARREEEMVSSKLGPVAYVAICQLRKDEGFSFQLKQTNKKIAKNFLL